MIHAVAIPQLLIVSVDQFLPRQLLPRFAYVIIMQRRMQDVSKIARQLVNVKSHVPGCTITVVVYQLIMN